MLTSVNGWENVLLVLDTLPVATTVSTTKEGMSLLLRID